MYICVCVLYCRANAYANMQSGSGPKINLKPDELAALKAGGKSVEELTGKNPIFRVWMLYIYSKGISHILYHVSHILCIIGQRGAISIPNIKC